MAANLTSSAFVCAANVLTGTGINAYHFALGNEERDTHDRSGAQCRRLAASLRRVTLQTRVSLSNLQLDEIGRSYSQRRSVIQSDLIPLLLFQPF